MTKNNIYKVEGMLHQPFMIDIQAESEEDAENMARTCAMTGSKPSVADLFFSKPDVDITEVRVCE